MINIMRSRYLSFSYLLVFSCVIGPVLAAELAISSLKVAYIYNIAKFTRWPVTTWTSPADSFKLCFYGNDSVSEGLVQLQKKQINGHSVVVLRAEETHNFQQCNAFYINTPDRRRYRYLLSFINQQTVLVITDNSPFFEYGGLINLVQTKQRLRFQVDKTQLANSQLKFSSKLLKLALLVDDSR